MSFWIWITSLRMMFSSFICWKFSCCPCFKQLSNAPLCMHSIFNVIIFYLQLPPLILLHIIELSFRENERCGAYELFVDICGSQNRTSDVICQVPSFETRSFAGMKLSWLTNEPQGSTSLCFSRYRVTSTFQHHTEL